MFRQLILAAVIGVTPGCGDATEPPPAPPVVTAPVPADPAPTVIVTPTVPLGPPVGPQLAPLDAASQLLLTGDYTGAMFSALGHEDSDIVARILEIRAELS
jgi:hypothetical protein